MFILKSRLAGLILLIVFGISFNSCTKSSKELSKATQAIDENPGIPDTSISESNQDLFNVNYKDFYDQLSEHGKWIQVNGKDFGITPKDTVAGNIDNKAAFLYNVFGINTAYAQEDVDVDFGMFFVWQPDPDLAVAVSVGNEPPAYVPYTDGQWVYTDDGWYFDGATPYEDVTFHYGRWVYNPYVGWVWAPGRVWAPAWVDWYDDDDYIAWTPVPPGCYFADNELSFRPYYYYDDDRYFVCEKRHFCDPDVFRYRTYYRDNGDRIWVHDLKRDDGLVVRKNLVIDPGPGVSGIEKQTGRKIEPVNVYRTNDRTEAGLSGNQLKSYSPQFSRVKNSEKMNVQNKPRDYVNYNKAANEYNRTASLKNSPNNNIAGNNNSGANNKWNVLGNRTQKQNTSGNYSVNKNENSNLKNGNNRNNYNNSNSNNRFSRKISKNSSGNKNSSQSNWRKNDKSSNRNYNSGNSNRKNYNNSSSKSYNNNSSRNSNHNSNRNQGNNNRSNNNNSRNYSGSHNNSSHNNSSHNNGSHNSGSRNNGPGNNSGNSRSNNSSKGNDKQKK